MGIIAARLEHGVLGLLPYLRHLFREFQRRLILARRSIIINQLKEREKPLLHITGSITKLPRADNSPAQFRSTKALRRHEGNGQGELQGQLKLVALRSLRKRLKKFQSFFVVGDRLLAGGQPDGFIPGLMKIVDGFGYDPRFQKMPGQLDGDLFSLLSIEGFQDSPHLFMKPRSLHLIEAVVKISLEQDVLEKIRGQALFFELPDAFGGHQMMPLVELPAQKLDQLPDLFFLDPGDHLGREFFTLDTGDRQDLPQFFIEPLNALFDDGVHARRERVPIQIRALHPSAILIPDQGPAFLHVPEQFNGKERMSFGLAVKRFAEGTAKPVGLGVDEVIHESTGFRFADLDLDLSEIAFEFVKDRLEGMTLLSSAESDLRRPKSSEDQDPVPRNPAAQMKEQAGRAGINPLEVVQDQEQRLFLGQILKHPGVLFQEIALLEHQIRRERGFALHELLQAGQPICHSP